MKRGSNRGEKHTREKMKKIVTLKTIINKAWMLYLDNAEEEQFINSMHRYSRPSGGFTGVDEIFKSGRSCLSLRLSF